MNKKIGLLITTYNRPQYLKQCFESLRKADLSRVDTICIMDDCSTDAETHRLIDGFVLQNPVIKYRNSKNSRIAFSVKAGCTFLFDAGCDIVINLDGDAIVRNDFIEVLEALHNRFPDHIVTGFNCLTRNANGTERHIIVGEGDGFNAKESVGGINMCFNKIIYETYILPALNVSITKGGNWDHMACINSNKAGNFINCAVPSVVQHIGIESSMGHSTVEKPDTADDFKPLHLPNVTLIGVDCVNINGLIHAAETSCKDIIFGDVRLLTSNENVNTIQIPHISSKEGYSRFIIKAINRFVETDFALIIQHDGYVLNHNAWSNDFFNYDYIGATWWYKDGMNVGNGGFSLRSKRLLDICATDSIFTNCHPEDDVICRKHRKYLEQKYNIKFAPEEVAKRFSVEGFRQPDQHYTNQFGFHGTHIKTTIQTKAAPATNSKQTLIISQFQGLGDIIFAMTLINDWLAAGHKVIWPVTGDYTAIQKHFPAVNFIDKHLLNVNHDIKIEQQKNGAKVIPLRWADQILKVHYKQVMRAKYDLYHTDWNRWREVQIVRDEAAERKLFYEVLGLEDGEQYNLINHSFRTDQSGQSKIVVKNGLRNIIMRTLPGFTMIDWLLVIQRATYIHTVSTAINYLIELYDCDAKEIHLYVRKPEEKDFSFIDYLLTKEYVRHL